MTRWHPLEPADADFLASAPHVFRYQKRYAATPEKVWESLVSDESLAAWGPMITKVTWTSPRPFGVGTTREVTAPGGSTMRERYFQWDEGHSHSFYVVRVGAPGVQALRRALPRRARRERDAVHVDGRDRTERFVRTAAEGFGAGSEGRLRADSQRRTEVLRETGLKRPLSRSVDNQTRLLDKASPA